jgi:hypothetical protein
MLKDMREVYPKEHEGYWGDYTPMLNSFGELVIAHADFGGYQGDTSAIIFDNGSYGYLNFGWGSCPFCDALQGCKTFSELNELAKYTYSVIVWCDSADKMISWLRTHDWEGDYLYQAYGLEVRDFISNAIEKITKHSKGEK